MPFHKSLFFLMLLPAVAACAPRANKSSLSDGYRNSAAANASAADTDIIVPPPVSQGNSGFTTSAGSNFGDDIRSEPLSAPLRSVSTAKNTLSNPAASTDSVSLAQNDVAAEASPVIDLSDDGATDETTPSKAAKTSSGSESQVNNTHVVVAGDTLYAVARRYKTTPRELIARNNLSAPYALTVGQRLNLGKAVDYAPAKNLSSLDSLNLPSPIDGADTASPAAATTTQSFRLRPPVEGAAVKAGYGRVYRGKPTNGIVYAAAENASVRAAADGRVVYVGAAAGYGQLVLIRHENGLMTNYGYLKTVTAVQGKNVKAGEVIGKSGSTADNEQPAVIFEVRKGSDAVDPKPYLQ